MTTPASPDTSAKASLDAFLGQYGLSGLADQLWTEHLNGVPDAQLLLDMRSSPTYAARFPAMAELAKQGRALTESQYISMENSYRDVLHSYGLPQGFYDQPADFAKFMTGNVSPQELNDRVKVYTDAVMGDTETLNQMQQLYGLSQHTNNPVGDLLAHYIDPTVAEPLLTEQLRSAQFAAASKNAGFGQLTAAQAEQFGGRQGITPGQAQQGFGQLVQGRELMQGLPGEGQGAISQQTQLGAAFGGNELAQEQIANRARLRVAEGSGGGGFSATNKGLTGLGSNET